MTSLLAHMIQIHAPVEGRYEPCRVPGCSIVKKPRRVMINHFQEKHCLRKNADGTLTTVPLPRLHMCKEAEYKVGLMFIFVSSNRIRIRNACALMQFS